MYFPLSTIGVKRKANFRFLQVGSRMIAGLLFYVLSSLLSGCGLLPVGQLPEVTGVPARAMIDDVPFYAQDELQCGPAALAMVLDWSGLAVLPADLSPEVYSPGVKGSLQSDLIASARRHGRVAYPITGMDNLLTEVSAGHPVIVLTNLGFFWYPKWHYAVVIGYDRQKSEVSLHSGLTAKEHLSAWVFRNIWQRSDYWGLLVLPPDRLPAESEEEKWLAAVAGLERVGQWQAAATGYTVALERWQGSFAAWMGLGNSRYSLNDLDGSAEAFRRATLLQPENGLAFNNLAHVLSEQGQQQEALAAARRAVELGGTFLDTFRQTLDEVSKPSAP
jgi:hypothetical protein